MTSQDAPSPLSPNSPTDFEWKPNKTGGATIRKLLADAENVVNYVLNEGDSLFADAANGDYALVAGSVAVDKGDAAYLDEALTTDLAGNERVVGTAVDLGAYELQNDATSAAFAEAFDEFDFFVDEDDLDALAKRFI